MNNSFLTLEQIDKEIQIAVSGNQISWARIGLLLLSVEYHEVWRLSSRSYTDWLKKFSMTYGKSESSCWRFLSSARYYLELISYLHSVNIEAPLLQDLSESVSPECLELLHKIERVLPSHEKLALAEKVITGNAKRAELRNYWHYYKPLLNGMSARENKHVISYVQQNPNYQQELVLANILKSLSDSNGKWISKKHKSGLTIMNLNLYSKANANLDQKSLSIDVVSMINNTNKDELEIHGVEVLGIKIEKDLSLIKNKYFYFNYFWLAIHEDFHGDITSIPIEFGVVALNRNNQFEIKKPAIKNHMDKQKNIQILEIILRRITN